MQTSQRKTSKSLWNICLTGTKLFKKIFASLRRSPETGKSSTLLRMLGTLGVISILFSLFKKSHNLIQKLAGISITRTNETILSDIVSITQSGNRFGTTNTRSSKATKNNSIIVTKSTYTRQLFQVGYDLAFTDTTIARRTKIGFLFNNFLFLWFHLLYSFGTR